MRLRGGAVLLWLVGCAGDDKPAQAEPIEATGGDTGADGGGAGSGGTGGTGTDTVDTGTAGGPRWLSWDGVETLTVDILADGLVECSFHWRTSGLHRATICDDCAFDFDVVGVVDEAASTVQNSSQAGLSSPASTCGTMAAAQATVSTHQTTSRPVVKRGRRRRCTTVVRSSPASTSSWTGEKQAAHMLCRRGPTSRDRGPRGRT